jgi:hypothetical protein
MNRINMSLLVAPMLPHHQVLGASPEDKIDWFKHSPENQRVAPLPNIPKGTNNDRGSHLAKGGAIPKVTDSITLRHIIMQGRISPLERLNRIAMKEEMLGSFRGRAKWASSRVC